MFRFFSDECVNTDIVLGLRGKLAILGKTRIRLINR